MTTEGERRLLHKMGSTGYRYEGGWGLANPMSCDEANNLCALGASGLIREAGRSGGFVLTDAGWEHYKKIKEGRTPIAEETRQMACIHEWHTLGTGERGRVVCTKCHRHGTVALDAPPPNHLARAREDHTEATLVERGSNGYLARLEGAIGHLIRHLEEEEERTR